MAIALHLLPSKAALRPVTQPAWTLPAVLHNPPAMSIPLDRRSFLRTSAALALGSSLILPSLDAQEATPKIPTPAKQPPTKPPALPPDQVQAAVGLSHRSLEKVRELVDAIPLLANACWDWGGSDFETPLQAAAHTGQRKIAEYLLGKGARLDLYAAAMLGQLDFVKTVMTLNPRAHEIPGPHGFTVLHCARRGGNEAKPVHDWLLAQGVPDVTFRPLPYVWPEGTAPGAT
jgi:hypothetical protein